MVAALLEKPLSSGLDQKSVGILALEGGKDDFEPRRTVMPRRLLWLPLAALLPILTSGCGEKNALIAEDRSADSGLDWSATGEPLRVNVPARLTLPATTEKRSVSAMQPRFPM